MKTFLLPGLMLVFLFVAPPFSCANELTGPGPVKSDKRGALHRFYTESLLHPVPPAGGWGQREVEGPKTTICPPVGDFSYWLEELQRRIQSNWEPVGERIPCVSMKMTRDGTFKNIAIYKSSGDQAADQAALEGVQYSSGFMSLKVLQHADIQYTFNRSLVKDKSAKFWQCRRDLLQAYPGLRQDFVLVHLIPSEVLNVVPGVQAKKVHCLKNLRILNPGVNPKKLVLFRRRWVEFLRAEPKPSWSDVLRKARELESDYSHILTLPADCPKVPSKGN